MFFLLPFLILPTVHTSAPSQHSDALFHTLKQTLPPTQSTFLDVIVHHIKTNPKDVPLHASGAKEWHQTWNNNHKGKDAKPFYVTGIPTWWRSPSFSCKELVQSHGDLQLDYQFLGTGWLPASEEEQQEQDVPSCSFAHGARRIPSCQVTRSNIDKEQDAKELKELKELSTQHMQHMHGAASANGSTTTPPPSLSPNSPNSLNSPKSPKSPKSPNSPNSPNWISWPSNASSAQQLYTELARAGYAHRTPTYLESNFKHKDNGGLIRALYKDDVLLPIHNVTSNVLAQTSRENQQSNHMLRLPNNSVLDTVFLYIGDRHSGTFLHQHGSSCSMSTGERIWLLYDPQQYCNVNETIPFHLPKRCPRVEGKCLEGLHPLDTMQHYFELKELGVQPLLHLQQPGEIFCFPSHWFHGTINLEPTVVVALVLSRYPDGPSHRCTEDGGEGKGGGGGVEEL